MIKVLFLSRFPKFIHALLLTQWHWNILVRKLNFKSSLFGRHLCISWLTETLLKPRLLCRYTWKLTAYLWTLTGLFGSIKIVMPTSNRRFALCQRVPSLFELSTAYGRTNYLNWRSLFQKLIQDIMQYDLEQCYTVIHNARIWNETSLSRQAGRLLTPRSGIYTKEKEIPFQLCNCQPQERLQYLN